MRRAAKRKGKDERKLKGCGSTAVPQRKLKGKNKTALLEKVSEAEGKTRFAVYLRGMGGKRSSLKSKRSRKGRGGAGGGRGCKAICPRRGKVWGGGDEEKVRERGTTPESHSLSLRKKTKEKPEWDVQTLRQGGDFSIGEVGKAKSAVLRKFTK